MRQSAKNHSAYREAEKGGACFRQVQKEKTITAKWKKDSAASGYLIECATDKKFKKNKVRAEVKKNKTVTATVGKLKGGSKYYVRICAYAMSGKTKVQGEWSKAKAVKVEK